MTNRTKAEWLRRRLGRVLGFYYPTCIDEHHGGFIAQLHPEDGTVYDPDSKHVVATARYTVNFARAARYLDDGTDTHSVEIASNTGVLSDFWTQVSRGLQSLSEEFHDDEWGGYHWLLDGQEPVDSRRVCYGHAFVVLAFAHGVEVGVEDARAGLTNATSVLEDRFYEPAAGLCRSEFTPDWTDSEPYRGQNANMHVCEALLAAHRATGTDDYLDRARTIARRLCVDLTAETDGRLWEHYDTDWTHDFAYNRETPAHQFRPWGYQPGHHVEWAKLLCRLDRQLSPAPDWTRSRARELFQYAIDAGWDSDAGGFYYTLDRDDNPVVREKYGWPVAEAIGAAAALYERTGDPIYLDWYDQLWEYAEDTLIAPGGNWYERATESGDPIVDTTGPAVEPGYHPAGACTAALRSFSSCPSLRTDGT